MGIRLRFLGILMIVFVATHFDFDSFTFRFESPTGVCEEAYSPERGFYCTEDSVILQRPIFERFIDLPTILVVWGFTFLVVYTRRFLGGNFPCSKGRRRISGCTWICSSLYRGI
jgi:hypothetical protein